MSWSRAAKACLSVCALVMVAHSTKAFAQGAPGAANIGGADLSAAAATDLFTRDRNVSVRQRPHPEYQSAPHALGAFAAVPTLNVTGEYNDNIYASSRTIDSDWIAHVQPRLDLSSNWSRHAVSVYADASFNRFAKHSSESTDDWGVGGAGRLDVVRGTNITFGADTGRSTEPRTSSSTQFLSAKPIRFFQSDAYVAGQRTVNRIRVSARYDWRKFNYENGVDTLGHSVFEDDRDRTVNTALGRVDYALSPGTAVFAQVAGNWRDYRLRPPAVSLDRTSHGDEVIGGANFELSNLLRGEIGAGYIEQKFTDRRFNKIDGFGFHGQLEWFPTQLTTLTATAGRTVEDSGIPGSSGYLSTNLGLAVDHELLRNLLLDANIGYGRDQYRGIDRNDDRWTLGASATYLMNRRLGWTLAYSHFNQTSKGANSGNAFTVNRVMLTATGHL